MKKHILLTLIAVALAASMLLVSCNQTPDDEKTKTALAGTWVLVLHDGSGFASGHEEEAYVFSGDNFEVKYGGKAYIKGTLTVSGSTLTLTPTHFWGEDSGIGTEAKWYSKAELKEALKQLIGMMGQTWTADNEKSFEEEWAPRSGTITVEGDTLTIKWSEGYTDVYKKK